MIVDSSAIIAILRAEPEAYSCSLALENAPIRRISAVNFVEAAIVIDSSRDPVISRRFDELVSRADLVVEPVTLAQARIARETYRDFGDCFAYALAKSSGEPLLFKGNDFAQTDITVAQK